MFSIDEFISESVAAATSIEPRAALSQLLEQTITQADALLSCMPDTDDDETLLHVSDNLTIYHIRLPAGILYPPHDHRMPVIIGFYHGCETSLIYEWSSNDELRQVNRLDFAAPCVAMLEPDVIHAISNFGDETSQAIHFYLGNLIEMQRSLWNLCSNQKMAFDNEKYFEFAKPNGPVRG